MISPNDPLIEGAKQCTRHLPRYERQYGVPVHLLSAISSTESGRWHDGLKIPVPWPWTINAEGKGYYFESKAEAITAVRRLQARGVRSIDVGCMQVNLIHHPGAFARLDDAFDPETNIAYAAGFLRDLYQQTGSWKSAAAAYHSKTATLGQKYVSRVFESWYRIIDKVRAAKDQVQTAEAAQAQEVAMAQEIAHRIAQPVVLEEPDEVSLAMAPPAPPQPGPKALSEQEGRKLATQKTPHIRMIEVSRKSPPPTRSREHGIIVVRPEVDDAQVAAVRALTSPNAGFEVESYKPAHRDSTLTVAANANAQESAPPAIAPAIPDFAPAATPSPDAKVLQVKSGSRKRGPNFIFNN